MEKIKSGSISGTYKPKVPSQNAVNIDLREYRPLEVTVSATLHDIRAHLLKVVKVLKCHFPVKLL